MKFLITAVAFITTFLFASIAQGQTTAVGIASGPTTGTNHPMVQDIAKVCSTPQVLINNIVTEGSLANIYKIYGDRSTQYGVVQEDALIYQQGLDKKMMDRIVMVFPFFSTEMHLVTSAKSNINSVADLAGKRVVEGPNGSATWVSVQVIKASTGIQWSTLTDSQGDGMKKILSGEADAMFIVAGSPIKIINDTANIKLVAISHPKLDSFKFYTKALIPQGTYGWQKSSIQTYRVNTVLATFAYKNQYQKEIGDLVTCITRNLGRMQVEAGFHPKWKSVDPLDIESITWPSHPAAVAAIKREMKRR